MDILDEMNLWPCHLPPDDLNPEYILDLGANIGLTMIDYLIKFPDCKVQGIELDHDNFIEAHTNLKNFGEPQRWGLFWAGISDHDGLCGIEKINSLSNKISDGNTNQCISIDTLFKMCYFPRIDYIKMDIEGSEKNILKDTSAYWPDITKCINAEVHGSYTKEECENDLIRLGFTVEIKKYTSEWNTWYHLIGQK
jgi:FkbM family methyltransferase